MQRLLLFAVGALIPLARPSADILSRDFAGLRETQPDEQLLSITQSQLQLLVNIQSIGDYLNFDKTKKGGFPVEDDSKLKATYHSNIVLVGFPSSSLASIKNDWFDTLKPIDSPVVTLGDESITALPGGILAGSEFTLIPVSDDVAVAIRDRMKLLLREYGDNDADTADKSYYINAWEAEEILESISETLFPVMTIQDRDPAMYVLNLNMIGSMFGTENTASYTYFNGFSMADVEILAKDKDLVMRAFNLLVSSPRATRLEVVRDKTFPSLDAAQFHEQQKREEEFLRSGGFEDRFMADEIKSDEEYARITKEWAKTFVENTESMVTEASATTKHANATKSEEKTKELPLTYRAMRILTSDPDSVLAKYKLSLAKSILRVASPPEMAELHHNSNKLQNLFDHRDKILELTKREKEVSDLKNASKKDGKKQTGDLWADIAKMDPRYAGAPYEDVLGITEALGTSTWVGHEKLVFKDVSAQQRAPSHDDGVSGVIPQPRALDQDQWNRLGRGVVEHAGFFLGKVDSLEREMHRARAGLRHHFLGVKSLVKQSLCDEGDNIIAELFEEGGLESSSLFETLPAVSRVHALVEEAMDGAIYGLKEECMILFLQHELLNSTIIASSAFEDLIKKEVEKYHQQQGDAGSSQKTEELEHWITEMRAFHVRLLYLAMESINAFLDISYLHADKVSEEATTYLGYLSALVLRTVRHLILPPMVASVNKKLHDKVMQHREMGLSNSYSKANDQQTSDRDRVSNTFSASASTEMRATASRRVSIASAYSGESLLHYVTSIGVSYVGSTQTQSVIEDLPSLSATHAHSMAQANGLLAVREQMVKQRNSKLSTVHSWLLLHPSPVFPQHINIAVYVVRCHNAYKRVATTIGDDGGFDVWTFMNEAVKLGLPNQQMTTSLHEIDLSEEKGLVLSIESCKREIAVDGADSSAHVYLDSGCIWSHLSVHDKEEMFTRKKMTTATGTSSFVYTKHINHTKAPIDPWEAAALEGMQDLDSISKIRHGDISSTELLLHTMARHHRLTEHIPIFILSVDNDVPLYVDGNEQATPAGNGVLVVQNRQSVLPSELSVGDVDLFRNGRNPLSAALVALASVVGGLPKASMGFSGATADDPASQDIGLEHHHSTLWRKMKARMDIAKLSTTSGYSRQRVGAFASHQMTDFDDHVNDEGPSYDYSFSGPSPAFETSVFDVPSFSGFDIEFVHRSRVLFSIAISREILLSELSGDHDEIKRYLELSINATQDHDWPKAAAFANLVYTMTEEALQAELLVQVKQEHEELQDMRKHFSSSSGSMYEAIINSTPYLILKLCVYAYLGYALVGTVVVWVVKKYVLGSRSSRYSYA